MSSASRTPRTYALRVFNSARAFAGPCLLGNASDRSVVVRRMRPHGKPSARCVREAGVPKGRPFVGARLLGLGWPVCGPERCVCVVAEVGFPVHLHMQACERRALDCTCICKLASRGPRMVFGRQGIESFLVSRGGRCPMLQAPCCGPRCGAEGRALVRRVVGTCRLARLGAEFPLPPDAVAAVGRVSFRGGSAGARPIRRWAGRFMVGRGGRAPMLRPLWGGREGVHGPCSGFVGPVCRTAQNISGCSKHTLHARASVCCVARNISILEHGPS
jgi:hypothetical protein